MLHVLKRQVMHVRKHRQETTVVQQIPLRVLIMRLVCAVQQLQRYRQIVLIQQERHTVLGQMFITMVDVMELRVTLLLL